MPPILFNKVKDYLVDHPFASNAEIRKQFDVSQGTITHARRQLRSELRNVRAPADKISPKATEMDLLATSLDIDLPTTKDVFETVAATEIMKQMGQAPDGELTAEEAKKLLSKFAQNPQIPYNFRIAAIAAKFKLDVETQDRHELGPGEPMSEQDAVERLALLMQACGPDVVSAAITKAFQAK